MRWILPLLSLLVLSCGYRLVGTYPEGSKRVHLAGSKVYVAPFKNRTEEPNVEYYITDQLVSSLQRTGKITIVSREEADYTVEGEVVGYTKDVVALDSSGDVSVYRLTISANVVVKDRDGKVLERLKGISEYEDYQVYSDIERTKSAEREAVERISQEIGQLIASLLL